MRACHHQVVAHACTGAWAGGMGGRLVCPIVGAPASPVRMGQRPPCAAAGDAHSKAERRVGAQHTQHSTRQRPISPRTSARLLPRRRGVQDLLERPARAPGCSTSAPSKRGKEPRAHLLPPETCPTMCYLHTALSVKSSGVDSPGKRRSTRSGWASTPLAAIGVRQLWRRAAPAKDQKRDKQYVIYGYGILMMHHDLHSHAMGAAQQARRQPQAEPKPKRRRTLRPAWAAGAMGTRCSHSQGCNKRCTHIWRAPQV